MRAFEILRESGGRSKPVDKEQFLRAAEKDIRLALDKYRAGWRMYRGNRNVIGSPLYADPTQGEPRKSRNTENYYTLVMDNSPKWAAYPKRSQSLVCSMDYSVANGYAGGNAPHIVLPVGDPVLGVCPKGDLWASFNSGIGRLRSHQVYDLSSINWRLLELAKTFKLTINDNDYGFFTRDLERIKQAYNGFLADPEVRDGEKESLREEYDFLFTVNGDILQTFAAVLDPVENGFRATPLSQAPSNDSSEVWVGAPCYLVGEIALRMLGIKDENL